MDPKISEFLSRNRVCVLTVVLPDETPHSAAMHYSLFPDFPTLFFSTDITSKKCLGIKDHQPAQASVVVGFSETDWQTIQMTGEVRLIADDEHLSPDRVASLKSIHYSRHPSSLKYADDPDTVFIEFVPHWWRFSDFSQSPAAILEQ